MGAVVHPAGEGEALFGGRIVIKASFEQLSVTETLFRRARPGADAHVHYRHADSFYVLEGELAFLVGTEEHLVGAGGFVCAPPGVVHGFRSTTRSRFLNFHTPDAGFAENLRERDRGEPGGFDSFDPPADGGLPASGAVLLGAGEGEPLAVDREELRLVEVELAPGSRAAEPPADHVAALYVLDGRVELRVVDDAAWIEPGGFAAAPPGAGLALSAGPEGCRLLRVDAPGAG
jgi:quercetin dioxygenase-like cupin family protein